MSYDFNKMAYHDSIHVSIHSGDDDRQNLL